MVIRLVTYALLVNGVMILRLVEGVDVGDRLERCLGRGWAFMLEQLYHMQILINGLCGSLLLVTVKHQFVYLM